MSKYGPLGDYLRKQRTNRVAMTFGEIERIIGAKLPNSQRYPAWWSNNPFNNVMTKVWREAGFMTEDVDVKARKLVFRRVDSPCAEKAESLGDNAKNLKKHPLIGALKGTIWIAPGTDLTEPADPEWGEVSYGDRNWRGQK
jgi:hypothetical protein